MDRDGFVQMLETRNLPAETIQAHIQLAERFEDFLAHSKLPADLPAAKTFIDILSRDGQDSLDNLYALTRYGRFLKNNDLYLAGLEQLDGGEVIGNLHRVLGEQIGDELRDRIFAGVPLPTWGTTNLERARRMRIVMERCEALVDAETLDRLLYACLRDLPDEAFGEDRQKYLKAGNFDLYLQERRSQFIADLEVMHRDGVLFFNQEITEEVLNFVRSHPEVSEGVRHEDILYVTKIPYMTKEYLVENDRVMKRYYACHCPWARELIIREEPQVSASFCKCSAGYHKKPWEIILEQPLEVDVLESVLAGDMRCRFAIHLPPGIAGN